MLRQLSRADWLWTLAPAALWGIALVLRPHVIDTVCTAPGACDPAALDALDAWSLKLHVEHAATWSDWVLEATLLAGFVVPLLLARLSKRGPAVPDIVRWGQTALWNAAVLEAVRLIVQRPRPLVYLDPATFAAEVSSYTSFYSGHVSFVVATWSALAIAAWARGVKPHALLLLGLSLTALTAWCRVVSGRHFPTDTLVGALAGLLIALTVAWLRRPRS